MAIENWGAEDNWRESLGGLRNTVRQELVAQQLLEHLPPPSDEITVLDVGCGQGTQILNLARAGYSGTGIDISADLLSLAEDQRKQESSAVQARSNFVQGDIHDLQDSLKRKFDIVLCHGVIMYMPSLEQSLQELSEVTNAGGIVSVLTRNKFSIAMRAGMKGKYAEVAEDIDTSHYTNGLGVENVRGDEPEVITHHLSGLGFQILQWYGVRLFSDHLDDKAIPENIDELISAERVVGSKDPYRQLCALVHVIGQKNN